jgi:hypothetical protein
MPNASLTAGELDHIVGSTNSTGQAGTNGSTNAQADRTHGGLLAYDDAPAGTTVLTAGQQPDDTAALAWERRRII